MNDYSLDIQWRQEGLGDSDNHGHFVFTDIKARVTIDRELPPEEQAWVMLHELLEMLMVVNQIPYEHEDINKLAIPIGEFILEHGFNPAKVFEKDD